jgi:hypothetical protein
MGDFFMGIISLPVVSTRFAISAERRMQQQPATSLSRSAMYVLKHRAIRMVYGYEHTLLLVRINNVFW